MAAAAHEDSDARLPRIFGPYLLLQRIAAGGMGEVFLAKSEGVVGIEKVCVVKRLRPHLTGDNEYVARFIDEARVMVQLSHRNICPVFDVGRVGNQYYLVMEFVAGKDLRTVTDRARAQGQPLTPAESMFIVGEVLEALDYAHRHKDPVSGESLALVHRDVSPQNVMVNSEGEIKLIDFGLVMSTKKTEQTGPNLVMGKIAYMAPEHARGEPVDGRADQFAAAMLLYELLAGERFYTGLSPQEIWLKAGEGGYVPLRWGSLGDELQAVIGRALAPQAEARYPSCGAFHEALQDHMMKQGLRAGSRNLRRRMEDMFTADLVEVREKLQLYSDVSVSNARLSGNLHDEEVFTIATTVQGLGSSEPTEMVARRAVEAAAAAQVAAEAAQVAAAAARAHGGEAAGVQAGRPSPPRRRPWGLALGAIALLGAAGGGLWAVTTGSPPADGPVVVPSEDAPEGALPPAGGRAPSEARALPGAAEAPGSGASGPPGDLGEAPEGGAARPAPAPAAPDEPAAAAAPVPAEVVPAADAPPPRTERARPPSGHAKKKPRRSRARHAARPAPARPARPLTLVEEIALLRSCPQSCAAPLVAQRKQLASFSAEELGAFKAKVKSCVKRCSAP